MLKKIIVIKKVLGEGLRPYGFEYYETSPNTWTFMRKKNEVEQYIDVYQSQFDQAVRVELYTSLDLYERKEIDQFYPYWEEKCNEQYFWYFSDKESFIQVLTMFLEIILEYGLDTLDKLSIPTRENSKITKDMFRLLYEQHDVLCEKFIKEYQVAVNEITEGIEKLYQLIIIKQDEKYESMKELFVEMASYYGNALCNAFKGKWIWENDSCTIMLKGKYGRNEFFPLQSIVACWKNIDCENYLMMLYNELV